jgi:hypothetical protein
MISPIYLDRAHHLIMDEWAWDFAYDHWNVQALEETLFWYAATGQAISHESTAERFWSKISRGRVRDLPPAAQERWTDIKKIVPKLRALDPKTAFGWFMNRHSRQAWEMLQEIKYVGPKIASWVLRDLSYLRDYATDLGDLRVDDGYPERKRDLAWFEKLPIREQALFQPLDRWVIRGAQDYGIIPASLTIERVQQDLDRYVETATTVTSWARTQTLEPRDLNVYFYLTGVDSMRRDGICCSIAEGAEVWWCYDGGDCVDPEQDWLSGRVVKCTLTDATVRIEGQLRDPKTGKPIKEKDFSVRLDLLRLEE